MRADLHMMASYLYPGNGLISYQKRKRKRKSSK
jgi:hypothetical protein